MVEKKERKADPCTITLRNVTLSFADIFAAKAGKPDKEGKRGAPKYHANGLMPKEGDPGTAANLAAWRTARDAAKTKKWGEDPKKWPTLKPDRVAVRDGDLEDWEGYEGNWYISASSPEEDKPLLVDRARADVTKAQGLLYSGAKVNLRVNIWAQDNEHGKRVNATLLGVQFVNHGTPFGNRGPVNRDEAFDDLSEEGEVEDMGGGASADASSVI